jgi:hypothetical protein
VTSEPVLAQPQLDQQFELEVDTSGFVFGAVLIQRGKDGKKHPIAFYSATATEAERNYDIYDLELLAIVKACRHWRPYLAGSPHKVIVHTDHANLQYWRQPHKISRRIAREVLELSEFDIELHHVPGKMSQFPLALSQKKRQRRSCTRCESMHMTLGINTRQTRRTLTGIRTMKITAWQLDTLLSPDRRG